jgi:hypothetical protein
MPRGRGGGEGRGAKEVVPLLMCAAFCHLLCDAVRAPCHCFDCLPNLKSQPRRCRIYKPGSPRWATEPNTWGERPGGAGVTGSHDTEPWSTNPFNKHLAPEMG